MTSFDLLQWIKHIDSLKEDNPTEGWRQFYHGLSLLSSQPIASEASEMFWGTASYFFSPPFLTGLWKEFFNQSDSDIGDKGTNLYRSLVRAFRLLCNCQGSEDVTLWIGYDTFQTHLVDSLYSAISSCKFSLLKKRRAGVQAVLTALDRPGLQKWMHRLALRADKAKGLLSLMTIELICRSWSAWLMGSKATLSTVLSGKWVQTVVAVLVEKQITPWQLMEHVFFASPLLTSYAAEMIQPCSVACQKELITLLAGLIGCAEQETQKISATRFLVALFQALPKESLQGDLEIELRMTDCLSHLLESANLFVRQTVGPLARAFGEASGRVELIALGDSFLASQASDPSSSSNDHQQLTQSEVVGEEREGEEQGIRGIADSDEESDIEGMAIDPEPRFGLEGAVQPSLRPRYLKACLEMLKMGEGDKSARLHHLAALESIPKLVEQRPADLKSCSAPLLLQLVNLADNFSIEGFEDLRSKAALSLLAAEPISCLEVVTSALLQAPSSSSYAGGGGSLSLGMKRHLLLWLRKAALAIARGRQSTATQQQLRDEEQEEDNLVENLIVPLSDKTRIKKPISRQNRLRLEIQNKKEREQSHKKPTVSFQDVAGDFFYPVIQMLLEVSHPEEGVHGRRENFNKIEELFGEEGSQVTASKEEGRKEQLQRLKGIDAVLPIDGLLAIATFLQCSLYTTHIRRFTQIALQVAQLFRDCPEAELRRVSLSVTFISLDCTVKQAEALRSEKHPLLPPRRSAMDSLLHIASDQAVLEEVDSNLETEQGRGGSLPQEIVSSPLGIELIEWIVATVSNDSDKASRDLKAAILKICGEIVGPR
eukprot:scaffold601_cov170-Ochromonas_danica.AAC.10